MIHSEHGKGVDRGVEEGGGTTGAHRLFNFVKHADGTLKSAQANEYPKGMSAGTAAAMVSAACKHQSIQTQVVPEEAKELFFSIAFTTPRGFRRRFCGFSCTIAQIHPAVVTTQHS